STSGMPVGTGFVVLLDQSDHEVARTLSASVGRFSLKAPRSGVYRLRSERIGYRAGVSQPFALTPDSALDYTLEVVPIPVVLAAVEVTGADVCHVHPDRARETALVWEEIRKALAATAWGTEQQVFRFSTYNYERDWDTRRDSVIAESGYTMEETASQSRGVCRRAGRRRLVLPARRSHHTRRRLSRHTLLQHRARFAAA
ncbi:MAG: carboxypeptidase-like regulatory domain-containing protein, partial [Gemmatimonadales bacterium]